MYLVDTDVLSEMRKNAMNRGVATWLRRIAPADFHISVISIVEVARGIERQQLVDPAFAERLERWLDTVITQYADTVIDMDSKIARRWGKLQIELKRMDLDVAIAATALERDLTIVTRNVKHLAVAGLKVFNPFLP